MGTARGAAANCMQHGPGRRSQTPRRQETTLAPSRRGTSPHLVSLQWQAAGGGDMARSVLPATPLELLHLRPPHPTPTRCLL